MTAGCGLVPGVTDREGPVADSLAVNTRQPQVAVEVAPATIADLEAQLSFDGTLEGRAEVDVVPDIAGRLDAVRVQLGDQVKRGQAIANVRDDDLASRVFVERARALKENPPGDDWDGVYVMTTK